MAINEHLETLISTLGSPEQQTQLRTLLEANPALGEGWMRQSDYSRRQDELRRQREEYEASMATERSSVAAWRQFHEGEAAREEQYKRELAARTQELEQLRAARAASGNNGDDGDDHGNSESVMDVVNKALSSRGYLTQADVDAKVSAAAKKFQEEYQAQRVADLTFTGAVGDQCRRFEREFNKPLASVELVKFMAERGINDPAVAMDAYAAKDRETLLIEKIREEVRAEEKAKLSAARLPGANAAPDSMITARQRLEQGKSATPLPAGQTFGKGHLGEAIAARRAAEGKPPIFVPGA